MYVSDEKGSTCAAEREAYLLRNFDFECPGTRFLAVSLWDNGIGANMNYIAVPALMAGLVTNRVVLFVNKVPGKRKIMSTRWSLASCPRRDFQCFFKAASPYVPTVKELNEAYGLTRTEKQDLFHRGEVPIGHENDKVIYMMGLQKTPSMHLGGRLESTLYNISMSLIDSAATKVADPALLRSAADSITSQDGNRPGYHFQFSTSKIHHGLLFYALRPSLLSKHRINSILNQVVPANFDPAKSIGLPIRGGLFFKKIFSL
ncbi:predicted protein [Phaeodactylum tricornutum CCAP 1055/1]|uniref:Uncharacterized protein n=2 Tax=Phaeodactylum tricornutum TaxID=2850 RepID=B7GBK3_PHATC|nr:predicted protein [Phaeodactylum tricornutum CCAP 1055/1]EEC43944.1 predicted protein [Phaeodactylum tricornutum CCAP 1055/1]|eukprot:XP_002184545.1 predicted protein [Phaeodactylum tricornutum CCAP 1055/1]